MRLRQLGTARVSGLCIGGNPFSGFSHQTPERSQQMRAYHTVDRIHHVLAEAEAVGINTFFGRTDAHIFDIVRSYWQGGGRIQWFAQVCPAPGDPDSWRQWLDGAAEVGATGAYIHGGVVDHWHASGAFANCEEALSRMRQHGLVAGFAGHRPAAHAWIRDHLEPDFQMCSHYNPTDRSQRAEHQAEGERWEETDRQAMLALIPTLPRPAVHYKVFAGGNRPVEPAFALLGQCLRTQDVACIGVFLQDDPDMLARDAALFAQYVDRDPLTSDRGAAAR
jgi:hypothetical protein